VNFRVRVATNPTLVSSIFPSCPDSIPRSKRREVSVGMHKTNHVSVKFTWASPRFPSDSGTCEQPRQRNSPIKVDRPEIAPSTSSLDGP
jgi:hypothetical protein